NRIITQDPYRQRIHLFDATDGRLVRRVLLRQPDIRSGLVDLVLTAGVLCGPDVVGNSERILAVDVETGANLWTLELDKPLIQLFEPREGFVGVGLLGGDLRIIEAVTGEVLLERRVPSVHAVVDAGMYEGTLIIQAVNIRRDKLHPELIGMDIATDTELWRRKDLTALGWQETPFDVIEGVVPAIVEHKNTKSPQVRRLDLVMIDARTGKNRGNVANLTQHRSQAPLRLDFDIRPGAAIVDTGLGIKAFRLERIADDPEKRF
ncbi:MAG: PQQ-binding-like beta-propeller repeat protein, partial [Planctomycetes bacterium]|nr:PQQ-binding-like beta-propeller repeat protein [Planctomycetota bacterium]